ncbi:MAG: DUF429 domain-containing protein [Polyangiales bacterium]
MAEHERARARAPVDPEKPRRRIVEAYPAAALSLWGIPRDDYKKPARSDRREAMLAVLERTGPPGWLSRPSGAR